MQRAGARIESIDVARGLIVALMALDHVRIFMSAAQFDPTDLSQTNAGWFFIRWVTHLCAPGFFFLAGMSAALMEGGGYSKPRLSAFLLIRGLWLIVLEIAVFGLAWSFSPGWFWFGVIWSLGSGMIVLAALIYIPRRVLLVVSAAFILLHNALWPGGVIAPAAEAFLYSGGGAELPLVGLKLILFPIVPWAAIMALGYASTGWLSPRGAPSPTRYLYAGLAAIAVFAAFRIAGFGGEAPPPQENAVETFLSFLNVEKYPPSAQFALVTLGVMALFMALAHKMGVGRGFGVMAVLHAYGRVPFFFYFLHLFLIHGLAFLVALVLGWPTEYLFWSGSFPNLRPPDGYGFGIAGVLLAWLVVLAILYPLCVLYGDFKAKRRAWWLRLL